MTNKYTPTMIALPPENVVVDVMTESGMETQLKRQGNLWFLPDGSMYVYYVPKYWRHLT